MRFIFMGTAGFACPTLQHLIDSPHEALAVVTQPDRPRGRGRRAAMSAVKECALEHEVTVLQPPSLRPPEVTAELAEYGADIIVVVAYGNILPPRILELPPYGCVNLHASLLPKYRGAAPINWALIHNESETGVTVIQMDAHVDTGPMFWRDACPIEPDDDALSLGERLAEMGAKGMVEVLNGLERGELVAQPQPEAGASMAPKLTRELGRLDWTQSATTLHNLIRALTPWPGCTAQFGDPEAEVKIWRASALETSGSSRPGAPPSPGAVMAIAPEGIRVACGEGELLVREMQPANRRRMSGREFAQGYRVQEGDRFG